MFEIAWKSFQNTYRYSDMFKLTSNHLDRKLFIPLNGKNDFSLFPIQVVGRHLCFDFLYFWNQLNIFFVSFSELIMLSSRWL